jgi:hypothetical protein
MSEIEIFRQSRGSCRLGGGIRTFAEHSTLELELNQDIDID